jgi:hypothetical protein
MKFLKKAMKLVMRLGMGSTKRKVHHLLKMRNNQRRKELTQIGSIVFVSSHCYSNKKTW